MIKFQAEKRIEVLAGYTQTDVLDGNIGVSYDYFDTIKEAKAEAKYLLTEDYRLIGEMSEPFKYAQVLVNGECLYDFFAKGYNGDPVQDEE
jgi:hypothetical protein